MSALNRNIEAYHEDPVIHYQRVGISGRFGLVLAGGQRAARQLYEWRSAVGDQWRDWDDDRRRIVLVYAYPLMAETFQIGDPVEVYLDAKFGEQEGWHSGKIFRIDPYSEHRSFYWVRFDAEAEALLGLPQISVFNPKNIRRSRSE